MVRTGAIKEDGESKRKEYGMLMGRRKTMVIMK
jgi:hypothetical protein